MNAAFLNQWQLYRRGILQPPVIGLEPRTESAFDSDVRAGEIRIFADTNRPLAALLAADCGLSGWRIVPLSPFCAPASVRECAVGEHVFQLWNATVVARRFAARSWRVDEISPENLARVRDSLAAVRPGRLTAGDGAQAKYEREFLIAPGTLVPLVPEASVSRRAWWRPVALLAASLAVLLAVSQLLLPDAGRRFIHDWRADAPVVQVAQESEEISLLDADNDLWGCELLPAADLRVEIDPPFVTWQGQDAQPEIARSRRFADVKGPRMPPALAKAPPARLRAAADMPLRVLFLASAPQTEEKDRNAVRAPARGPAEGYAAARAPLERAPHVVCTLADAGSAGALLTISGEAVDGAKVTVLFDPACVRGYVEHVASVTGTLLATYEILAAEGREISPEAVRVTLIWPSAAGDARTPLEVAR